MGLQKGQTNNPNGRPQGTANKVTTQLRDILYGILEEEINNLAETLKSVDS